MYKIWQTLLMQHMLSRWLWIVSSIFRTKRDRHETSHSRHIIHIAEHHRSTTTWKVWEVIIPLLCCEPQFFIRFLLERLDNERVGWEGRMRESDGFWLNKVTLMSVLLIRKLKKLILDINRTVFSSTYLGWKIAWQIFLVNYKIQQSLLYFVIH